MSNVSEVVVSGPASPKIASLDDLSGKEVFVRKSSSYYESLVALNKKFAGREESRRSCSRKRPRRWRTRICSRCSTPASVALIVVDKHKADFWKQIFPKLTVHDNVAVRTGGEIAWAIRKGSPQLKAALDDFATRNKVGTATGNQVLTRYLKNVKYVKNAASEEERKKFLALIQYFQKYGDQVRRGLGADGRAGLPGVAAQPECKEPGGRDRRDAGDARHRQGHEGRRHHGDRGEHPRRHQVHALDDRPVLREGADDEAGQGAVRVRFVQRRRRPRCRQLRKEAAKRGLDPNVWFQNVEYVAAEKIGQETVTYVSNIYKYYIAYRLVLESQAATKEAVEKMKGGTK